METLDTPVSQVRLNLTETFGLEEGRKYTIANVGSALVLTRYANAAPALNASGTRLVPYSEDHAAIYEPADVPLWGWCPEQDLSTLICDLAVGG